MKYHEDLLDEYRQFTNDSKIAYALDPRDAKKPHVCITPRFLKHAASSATGRREYRPAFTALSSDPSNQNQLVDGLISAVSQLQCRQCQVTSDSVTRILPELSVYGHSSPARSQNHQTDNGKLELFSQNVDLICDAVESVECLFGMAVVAMRYIRLLSSSAHNARAAGSLFSRPKEPVLFPFIETGNEGNVGALQDSLLEVLFDCFGLLQVYQDCVAANDILVDHWNIYKVTVMSSITSGECPILFRDDDYLRLFCQRSADINTSIGSGKQCLAKVLTVLGRNSGASLRSVGALWMLHIFLRSDSKITMEAGKSISFALQEFMALNPAVILMPLLSFYTLTFAKTYLPEIAIPVSIESCNLPSEQWNDKIKVWKARMDSAFSQKTPLEACIKARLSLYLKGHEYGRELNRQLNVFMVQRLNSNRPITKSDVMRLMECIFLCNDVLTALNADSVFTVRNWINIVSLCAQGILDLVWPSRDAVIEYLKKKPDHAKSLYRLELFTRLDSYLRAMTTDFSAIFGAFSVVDLLADSQAIDGNVRKSARVQLHHLKTVLEINVQFSQELGIEQLIFWNIELVQTYLSSLLKSDSDDIAGPFTALVKVINRIPSLLKQTSAPFIKDFMRKMNTFLDGVAGLIEKDIRLLSHHEVHGSQIKSINRNLKYLLNIPGINILGYIVDVKEYVTLKLSKTFYEYIAINPPSRQVYEKMKIHALYDFGIHLIPETPYKFSICSPAQLVLASNGNSFNLHYTMLNILQFCSDYNYISLKNAFYQKQSTSKYLLTVSVRDFMAEIETNGEGIVFKALQLAKNACKRLIGQFLAFCKTDYILSIISKQHRNHLAMLEKLVHDPAAVIRHAIELRAQFIKYDQIRNDGVSSLNRLCEFVKQIGNAFGFIRLCLETLVENRDRRTLNPSHFSIDETQHGMTNDFVHLLVDSTQGLNQIPNQNMIMYQLIADSTVKSGVEYVYLIFPCMMLFIAEESVSLRRNLLSGTSVSSSFQFSSDSFIVGMDVLLSSLNCKQEYRVNPLSTHINRRTINVQHLAINAVDMPTEVLKQVEQMYNYLA